MSSRSRTILAALALLTGCAATPRPAPLSPATTQLVLVHTANWEATAATLQRFELLNGDWREIGDPIDACVGRSGLGWGIGEHHDGAGPRKHEGDGRAPAGTFALGLAFGYAEQPPIALAMPYRQATSRDYYVDAPSSPAYNTWQRLPPNTANTPTAHWPSFERMRRDDLVYEFGLVVEHNRRIDRGRPAPAPGRGSAIFVHVWSGPGQPTSGCTAMSRDDMLTLLAWLRPEAEPRLVQLPIAELPDTLRALARPRP